MIEVLNSRIGNVVGCFCSAVMCIFAVYVALAWNITDTTRLGCWFFALWFCVCVFGFIHAYTKAVD